MHAVAATTTQQLLHILYSDLFVLLNHSLTARYKQVYACIYTSIQDNKLMINMHRCIYGQTKETS